MMDETTGSFLSMADLMAAMPHILAAPRESGPIQMLCTRPARHAREFPGELTLNPTEGIPGDRWLTDPWLRLPDGRPDPSIQVSILPVRVLDLVWRDRRGTPHPGDPISADLDLSVANLPAGSLLQAGSAVLRVSDVFNDGCVKWKARYGADAKDWITRQGHPALRLRGILCAVETAGVIRLGDRLTVLRRGPVAVKA
jgi:hypothetical protein